MKERYTEKMLGPSLYKPDIKYGFMRKGKFTLFKFDCVERYQLIETLPNPFLEPTSTEQ